MGRKRTPVPCLACDGTGQITTTRTNRRTGEAVKQEALCMTCSGDANA
ncbi:hypothetical protein AGRA3207_007558 [Actinomadura graeca]|uniref:Molecular chaperone DnaJ n=1 Tax=Actinomadura graeca TaxID=2750812 RepID=A0ABX8R6E0_9ACTN|nr:hypothetical protein [Actinomadura graeca]QXJ25984.1 hypothetical protein AGRA3207_007558 [Actinomadura graeca]